MIFAAAGSAGRWRVRRGPSVRRFSGRGAPGVHTARDERQRGGLELPARAFACAASTSLPAHDGRSGPAAAFDFASIATHPPPAAGAAPVVALQPAPAAHEAVVQRLGKTGHIVAGAAIGSFLPILGNIVGGYLGYRVWKSKQRGRGAVARTDERAEPRDIDVMPALRQRDVGELRSLERRVSVVTDRRTAPQGEDPLDPRRAEVLLEWIEETRRLIQSGRYRDAYERLTQPEVAERAGAELKADFLIGSLDPVLAAQSNMFYPDSRRVKINKVFSEDWLDDGAVAEKALAMHLEEYMHLYQFLSGRFLARSTGEFKSTDPETGMGWDYDEIDVMAMLDEWGFDVEDLHYVERYDERKAFWRWRNG